MVYTSDSVIELARDLAKQFASRATEADKLGQLPLEDVQVLKDSGYLAINIPKKFGGSELSIIDCVKAQLEIAQGSPSTAMLAAMPLHIFGQANDFPLEQDEHHAEFCKQAVAGAIFNFASSEPKLGSPANGMLFATTAQQTDEGLLINGHKSCTTGGKHLTHMFVTVTYNGQPAAVLVEANRTGVSWQESWGDSLSLRASDSHDVLFNDVLVPETHLLSFESPEAERNRKAWFTMMISAVYLGAAIGARNTVIQYALERVPTGLGKPIAVLPSIQRQIGEIDVSLQAAKALLMEAAADWHHLQHKHVLSAKHFITQVACQVTEQAINIAGAAGLSNHLPLERYFRDVRAGLIQPPKGDMALELIGKSAIADLRTQKTRHSHS